MKTTDQLHRIIQLKDMPKRIISLVPSQTELLYDLGLEERIIGITKFCIHPKHLRKSKTVVGGTKDIKIEIITSLSPDIILCNKEENTEAIVEACSAICPTHVSDIYTIDDCLELINQYGKIFSVEDKSHDISEEILQQQKDFSKLVETYNTKSVAYFIWRNPWMVAAKHTFINHMLNLNKFENVFKDLERYPEINLEALPKDLELILLSSEPYPFKEKHVQELEEKLPNTKIMLVDGEAFSWYGSHLLKSFEYFKALQLTV